MIGTSTTEYLFIRACIFFLHWITPLSILYSAVVFAVRPPGFGVPRILEAWIVLETAFYFLVVLPRKHYLQKAAVHPEPASRKDRRILYDRCKRNIKDPARYLSMWFKDAPLEEIKRENVKEFLRWGFMNTGEAKEEYEDELDEYVDEMEEQLGEKIEPGRGKAECLRLTLDEVDMLHRSIFWYLCVFVVDTLASCHLYYHSFSFYRSPLRRFFAVFPPRPLTLLTPHVSPAKTLTYWHRPHTSKTKLPILFIHGIGIGLYPYVKFLGEINDDHTTPSDGDVGIIAVEIMPVSFRITGEALEKEEMCREIDSIVKSHGWEKFVLVSHSYGSIISTHLLHTPSTARKIGPILSIDPVSFLLHLPSVAYNFTHRTPRRANEHQLHYFASKDMGVAHTLGRRFFWNQNICWKEDLQAGVDAEEEKRRVTVVLGGRDLIVDTESVGTYLAVGDISTPESGLEKKGDQSWKTGQWKGTGLDVLWFEHLDHAQVFDKRADRARLIGVLRAYCRRGKGVGNGNGNGIGNGHV
ncbi:hypothetical protein K490DRAFT_64621 [Saccharata proteae CBS 121410]|uniref:AB hydrolase-1 domain-containing protein n=1 Tax=Saccharata proteae CBS 121410 TaxID=1314787 RepID=A0A9P4M160_9PEZI|nr:hypothetical protein K490DRAFT_64621 [Saccharata proteae CBS 121410]